MTHRTAKLSITALAMAGLSGCIGTENPDFNQEVIDGAGIIAGLENQQVTPVSEVPDTGSATYGGVAGFNLDQQGSQAVPYEMLADIELTADFTANNVTGSLSSFTTPDGEATGTIPLTNGARVGNAFVVDANGQIGLPEGDSMTIAVDMTGVFRGAAATGVSGAGEGTYTLQDSGESGDLFVQFGAD